MAVRDTTINLHRAIQDDFDKLSSVKEFGVPKYTTAYIMHKLANKYFRSAKTIENIVFGRTYTANLEPQQMSLELQTT